MVSHIFDKNRLLHTIIGEWLKNIIEIALGYLNIIWLKHSLFINVKKWLPNDINLTSIHHHFFSSAVLLDRGTQQRKWSEWLTDFVKENFQPSFIAAALNQ